MHLRRITSSSLSLSSPAREIYFETRGPVEQLNDVSHAGFTRSRILRGEFLHHEEHEHFARQGRAIFQGQENQFQHLLLHRRTEKLTTARTNGRPEIGGQLLRILMVENQVDASAFAQTSCAFQGFQTAFAIDVLTIEQTEDLPHHRTTENRLTIFFIHYDENERKSSLFPRRSTFTDRFDQNGQFGENALGALERRFALLVQFQKGRTPSIAILGQLKKKKKVIPRWERSSSSHLKRIVEENQQRIIRGQLLQGNGVRSEGHLILWTLALLTENVNALSTHGVSTVGQADRTKEIIVELEIMGTDCTTQEFIVIRLKWLKQQRGHI